MVTIYLGNRADDERKLSVQDDIFLNPSAKACGGVSYIKQKQAYRANAWKGISVVEKYFYAREKRRQSDIKDDSLDSQEAALTAAQKWYDDNNTNIRSSVIAIKASEYDDTIGKHFYWKEPYIEYPETSVIIDPYFLGLWLGDGTSTLAAVCSIDEPIISYLRSYSESLGCHLVNIEKRDRAGTYKIVSDVKPHPVKFGLSQYELLKNKHIPDAYLRNSQEVRLQLLAGLIDTDVTLGANTYDITQKSEKLSLHIMELARSLGLYSNMVTRLARATNGKKEEPSTYFRVFIHMSNTSLEIPTKLQRKHWTPSIHPDVCDSVKITLDRKQESFRHEWTPTMIDKLVDVIPRYTSIFGKIAWRTLQEKEAMFSDFSSEAIRSMHKKLMDDGKMQSTSSSGADALKQAFLTHAGQYQTLRGKVRFQDLLKINDFKQHDMQSIRTVMNNLSAAEKQGILDAKAAYENQVRQRMQTAIPAFTNSRGGISWSSLVDSDAMFQHVGLSQLRKMYQAMIKI